MYLHHKTYFLWFSLLTRFNWAERGESSAWHAAWCVWVAYSCWQLGDQLWWRTLVLFQVSLGMMLLMPFLSFHFFFLISSGRTWRLEDVIAKLNEKYGTLLLVNFFVGTDDRDSTSHIIHVGVRLWQGKDLTSLCSYSKSPHVPLFTESNE